MRANSLWPVGHEASNGLNYTLRYISHCGVQWCCLRDSHSLMFYNDDTMMLVHTVSGGAVSRVSCIDMIEAGLVDGS